MCLIVIAIDVHPNYGPVILANRDESYARPTQALHHWDGIIAGKDLLAGGTWMGLSEKGKIACLTNYRDGRNLKAGKLSRGEICLNFLKNDQNQSIQALKKNRKNYAGFNLIYGNESQLTYYSQKLNQTIELSSGIWGLSNQNLDTPWPKVEKTKKGLFDLLIGDQFYNHLGELNPESFFSIMTDESEAQDSKLPDTYVPIEWERRLSAIFVKSSEYGTRSTSLFLFDKTKRHWLCYERTYDPSSLAFIIQAV